MGMGFSIEEWTLCKATIKLNRINEIIYMGCSERFLRIGCSVEITLEVEKISNSGSLVYGRLALMEANEEGHGYATYHPKLTNRGQLCFAQETWLYKATIPHAVEEEIEGIEHDLWEELEVGKSVDESASLEE